SPRQFMCLVIRYITRAHLLVKEVMRCRTQEDCPSKVLECKTTTWTWNCWIYTTSNGSGICIFLMHGYTIHKSIVMLNPSITHVRAPSKSINTNACNWTYNGF